ncbi:pantoate--beta-alanine ligase [Dongia sp.]|uniref:pantoate--beta-alanine ligase n=1 Tax=Dongia sp. TaxID=1977262 RepID=UPI0035B0E7AE
MTRMIIVRRVADLRAHVSGWRGRGESVGLVPTMGALHDGHLSLVRRAKDDNVRAVATIFVNPTQFGPNEDLSAYPRDEAGDAAKLESVGCDLLFAPDVSEMYPAGFATSVSVAGITDHLDGIARPGHFGGVATIVAKLLLQALPDRAYFGEKDYQQLQVIKRLARDLDMPVEICGVPTVREADGLALSSRNRYLSAAERQIAGLLPRALAEAAQLLADGRAAAPLLTDIEGRLIAAGFGSVDYIALCDGMSLEPLAAARPGSRIFAAARIGRTRLIDNWPVL